MQETNVETNPVLLYKLKEYRIWQVICAISMMINVIPWLFITPVITLFGGPLFLLLALPPLAVIAQSIVLIAKRNFDAWYKAKLSMSILLVFALWGVLAGLVINRQFTDKAVEWLVYSIAALVIHALLWLIIAVSPKISRYQLLRTTQDFSAEAIAKVKKFYARSTAVTIGLTIGGLFVISIIGASYDVSETGSIGAAVGGLLIPAALFLVIYFIIRRNTVK